MPSEGNYHLEIILRIRRNIGECLVKSRIFGKDPDSCNFSSEEIIKELKSVYAFLDTVQSTHRVIRIEQYLCDGHQCGTHEDSVFLYRDSSHLSYEGSAWLGRKIDFYELITGQQTHGNVP